MKKSNMDTIERIKMVKAMEFIARQINDEELFDSWLACGVADGDVDYGDLTIGSVDDENVSYYIDDDEFADIMGLFLRIMRRASKSGGLYCDNVTSAD